MKIFGRLEVFHCPVVYGWNRLVLAAFVTLLPGIPARCSCCVLRRLNYVNSFWRTSAGSALASARCFLWFCITRCRVVSFHSNCFCSVASCCIAWSRLLSVWTGGGHCVGGRQECASLALLQRCPSGIIAPSGVLGLVLLVVQLWCSGILLRFAAEPVEVLLARHPFGVEQACSARFFAVSILVPCSSSCWHECSASNPLGIGFLARPIRAAACAAQYLKKHVAGSI